MTSGPRDHRSTRVALIVAVGGAVASSMMAVTVPRFTDEYFELTLLIELVAAMLYLTCVVAVFKLSNRSKHTFWLLVFAPLAFWRYLEFILTITIWTIRGGIV